MSEAFTPILILAADCLVDGRGTLTPTNQLLDRLSQVKARAQEFKMSSLKDGWETPLPQDTLRRACSPMSVMMEAQRLFQSSEAEAVIFSGREHFKSDFKDKKNERDRLMKVYEGKRTFLDAYNELAHAFLKYWKMTREEFRSLAKAPWNNTTLQALAVLVSRMKEKRVPSLAGLHSIASIGYQQAFAVLRNNSKEI